MKKQKIKILAVALIMSVFLGRDALAVVSAGATVYWIKPLTDEGNSNPADVTGYRIYYTTNAAEIDCINWNNDSLDTRRLVNNAHLPATYQNVPDGTKLRFSFSNTSLLTLGTTYYFAVVAYDAASNLSKCAVAPDDTATMVSKLVTYPADISTGTANASLYKVDGADYSLLHANYSLTIPKPGNAADINGDEWVNGGDYSFLHAEYNQHDFLY